MIIIPVYAKNTLKKLLEANKSHPDKAIGQNYIIDEGLCKLVVHAMELHPTEDDVLEIGPGFGAFSDFLVARSRTIFLVDIDSVSIDFLDTHFKKNENIFLHSVRNVIYRQKFETKAKINLLEGDILKIPFPNCHKLISNVPFPLSYSLIVKFVSEEPLDCYVLILQKEFVQHLLAKPGESNYSVVSPLCNLYFDIEILEDISPDSYYPSPKVKTQLIRLTPQRRFAQATPYFLHRKMFIRFIESLFEEKQKRVRSWIAKISHTFSLDFIDFTKLSNNIVNLGLLDSHINQISETILFQLMADSLNRSSIQLCKAESLSDSDSN